MQKPLRECKNHIPTSPNANENFLPIRRYRGENELPPQGFLGESYAGEKLFSGRISIGLTALSPVLVGGTIPHDFFHRTDGNYGIPGSSFRGEIRRVMNILGCGLIREKESTEEEKQGIPLLHRKYQQRLFLDYPYGIMGYYRYKSRISVGDLLLKGTPEYPFQDGFLPRNSQFVGDIFYRNLRKDELGLLLWCLTLEGKGVHLLGQGKSEGNGRLKPAILELEEYQPAELYTSFSYASHAMKGACLSQKIADLIGSYKQYVKHNFHVDVEEIPMVRNFFKKVNCIEKLPEK